MKEESWEYYYWMGEPSPMRKVAITCYDCDMVQNFHEKFWRAATAEEIRYIRLINFFYAGYCEICWKKKQEKKKKQEEEDEE